MQCERSFGVVIQHLKSNDINEKKQMVFSGESHEYRAVLWQGVICLRDRLDLGSVRLYKFTFDDLL